MSASASAFALATICRWYARQSGVSASRNATALAAITCISGPPCMPGITTLSSAWACVARHMTMPPRGPRSVLCVVEVTKSAYGIGVGWSPAATSPAGCAMSAIRRHPTSSAISRKGLKSIALGKAEPPATSSFGRCSRQRSRTWSRSIRSSSRRTPYGTIR